MNKKEVPTLTESPQPLRSRRFHRSGSRREEHCEEECCEGEVLATDQDGNTVSPFPSMETGLERSIREFSFDYTPMSLPEYWSPMESEEVQTVPLDANSPEFLQVAGLFYRTADNSFVITRIDRVQNPYLYRSYMVRKQKMDKDSGRNCERLLFHGTSRDNANRINTQGFDRAFHGESAGIAFGRGTYFARDASYSLGYTNPADEEKCMYLARVLVWRFCQGNPEMRAPPPINPHRPEILYDSTVDKPVNPTIFVVFSDNQSYPEYLITFR